MGDLLHKMRPADSLIAIETLYPTTLACFLVAQGVSGYQHGDYWSAVEQALGFELGGNWTAQLGRIFERFLELENLPLFPEMRERAARYTSLALAHGGIPNYCLGDFFRFVVKPSLRPILANYPVEARLDEVLSHYTGDRPVKYFLENGGNVALDFYQRSCELAQDWYATGEVPAAETIGLPEHVLAFFRTWAQENLKPSARERDTGARLRRPELVVDPWGSGLVLRLPPQPVPVASETTATWVIQELNRTIPVRISFGKTAEADIPIRQPLELYSVSLQIDEKMWKWTVEGFRAAEPIMVFLPGRGRWQARLTADELWLFYPRSHSLEPLEGEAVLAEELLDLSGGWRGQGWDLKTTRAMGLRQPNGEVIRLGIRLSEQNKPSLIGIPRLASSSVEGQIDVFVGRPPDVRIPLSSARASDAAELQRWVLAFRALDNRSEQFRRAVSAIDPAALKIQDNAAVIRLAEPSLLGLQPFGTYSVKLSGPIGRDAHFVFGCLPELQVRGLDDLLVPDPRLGPLRAAPQIELTPSEDLELADESRGLAMRQIRANLYEVNVPGSTRQLQLSAVRALEDGSERRVPLILVLRRLQWRLVGGDFSTSDWTGQTLRLPIATLLNEPATALLIDLPGIEPEQVQLNLRLVDVDGETHVNLLIHRQRTAPYWRFELAQLHDTLRSLHSPAMRLEMECIGLPGDEAPLYLPVLDLTRELLVERIQGHWQKTSEGNHLRLTWREDGPVKSRLLLIWPAWRPWEPSSQWPIPDSAQGEIELFLPNDRVPPGHYRLSIVTKNPWADAGHYELPEQGSSSTFELSLATPESRLAELDTVSNLGQAFQNDLERACIHRATGALTAFDLDWCCNHLELAGPRELVALCQLVEDSRSAEIQSEFSRRLFYPDYIEKVVEYYDSGKISDDDLEAFSRIAIDPEQWSEDTCLALVEGPYSRLRVSALKQLVSRDLDQALPTLLKSVSEGQLSEDEFIQLASIDKYIGLDALSSQPTSPLVRRLTKLLEGFSILVRPQMWLESDAGYGQIKRIEDLDDKTSVDQFFEDDGAYSLHVALHVELDSDWRGESAIVNMRTHEIRFPRASKLFVCARCGFTSGKLEYYRSHLQYGCGGAYFVPPQPNQVRPLARLKFWNSPKQSR